jgi:HEXXH motif-containing protein
MNIDLGFAPNAQRALLIDRRMNLELAASLRYVVEQVHEELDFDAPAMLRLALSIESGGRVDAEVFGWYYNLVMALLNADVDQSLKLLSKLQSAKVLQGGRCFVQLRDPAVCARSELYLGKFLESVENCMVHPPSDEVAGQFVARFDRGLALLRRAAPELACEVDAIVHEVVPVVGDLSKPMQIDGGSHYQLWGALFLNTQFHPTDEAMVEVIAHESAHSLLFGFCAYEPLTRNDEDARYSSPLRPDPRPMDGIYHATFVSARMYWVMDRMLQAGVIEPERRDAVRAARDLDKRNFEAGLSVVRQHADLTDLGRNIMDGAEHYMASA